MTTNGKLTDEEREELKAKLLERFKSRTLCPEKKKQITKKHLERAK